MRMMIKSDQPFLSTYSPKTLIFSGWLMSVFIEKILIMAPFTRVTPPLLFIWSSVIFDSCIEDVHGGGEKDVSK